jgi:hypothetical protein
MTLFRSRSLRHLLVVVFAAMVVVAACGEDVATDESAASADDAAVDASTSDDGTSAAETTSTVASDASTESEPEAEPDGSEAAGTAEPTPAVYDGDFSTSIQPIFEEKCAVCHFDGGPGASHWNLQSVADVVDTHLLVSDVITTNYMPPWPASGESVAFKGDRSLRPDQIQAVLDWVADGAPIDVEPDTSISPAIPVAGLTNPDLVVLPPQPYMGDPNVTDDYRCQIYDLQLDEGGWITGFDFVPDEPSVVHHAIGYLMSPESMERAQARDGEDGRTGWECYGGSGAGESDMFLGWAPGQDATEYPEGNGLWVPPGGFVVVQIHYHYEGSAPADASSLELGLEPADADLKDVTLSEFLAPVEIPCMSSESGPLCDRDAAMADALERFGGEGVRNDSINRICGVTPDDFAHLTDGLASSSCSIPAGFIDATGEIVSVFGHMHEIGDWFRLTINKGTPDELVLLDIPVWDFDWQYNYEPVDSIVLGPQDIITVECGWDRSLRRSDLEPAYILWADGTNDEMCFTTLTTRPA